VLVATQDRELIRQVGCRAIMLDQGVIVEETQAAGDVSRYLTAPGATDENEYEQSASSGTAEWGSVDQVGPLGLVEAPEAVMDDSVATELRDALEGAAEQPLAPLADGGATAEGEADKPADTDVFAALDAAFAGSEPAVPGDIGESRRKPVRRDETG
jgi:hypothetical protein